MNLEDVTAEIRPRRPWEAADLGFALVREHYSAIIRAWLLGALPLMLVAAVSGWLVVHFLEWSPFLVVALLWWLKPLTHRVPVRYLSRALFGAPPTTVEMVKALPQLFFRRLWHGLFTGRIDTRRCLILPVVLLEGLKGKACRDRARYLSYWGGRTAGGLAWAFLFFDLLAMFSLIALVSFFVPQGYQSELQEFFSNPLVDEGRSALTWGVVIGSYILGMCLTQPFYAGAGFGVYINSRIILEGWDVEIGLRRLATRIGGGSGQGEVVSAVRTEPVRPEPTSVPPPISMTPPGAPKRAIPPAPTQVTPPPPPPSGPPAPGSPRSGVSVISATLIGLSLLASTPSSARAQDAAKIDPNGIEFEGESTASEPNEKEPTRRLAPVFEAFIEDSDPATDYSPTRRPKTQRQIDEVLADPDFEKEIRKRRVRKDEPEESRSRTERDMPSGVISGLGSLLFWLCLAALLCFVSYALYQNRHIFATVGDGKNSSGKLKPVKTVMGMNMTPESLPSDIPTSAWELWSAGDRHGALGLLYRGSLSWMVGVAELPIRESDTESECLGHAQKLDPQSGQPGYFASLTNAWMGAAYGLVFPADDEMQSLCQLYPYRATTAGKTQPVDAS